MADINVDDSALLKVMFAFSCMPKISGSSNCGSELKLSVLLQSDSVPILAAVG